MARGDGTVRLVTIAPELEGALDLITAARSAGVVVSIGHTDADYATTKLAFDAGASHATHLFNAMAPVHHRRPGRSLQLSETSASRSRSSLTASTYTPR